jgi:acid phosphatase (class A)
MKLLRRLLLCVVLAASSASLVRAAEAESQAPAKKSYFIESTAVDVAKLLPAPPEAGSLAALADLEAVLRMQASRTPADVAFSQKIAADLIFADFADILGPWFNAKDLPYTNIFLKHVTADAATINGQTKKLFNRPRPPTVDPTVRPVVEVPSSSSYPSGHSMRAYLWAAVLSELYPDHREALFARAHEIAWARVVGGVHFPTDTIGGRIMAAAIVSEIVKNPAFQKAVEEAKAEAAPFQEKKAA